MVERIDKKFKMIFNQEVSIARAIARRVVQPKPITVWEVMIPILLLFTFMRNRQIKDYLEQNILFTKKLALEAAYEMTKNHQPKESVLRGIQKRTDDVLSSDKQGIYSEEIRAKQMEEIKLLVEHYVRLLKSRGENYAALVFNAYRSSNGYKRFLRQLETIETEVTQAAQNTLREKADEKFVEILTTTIRSIRKSETEKIFG